MLRLQAALTTLQTALAAQREVVANWRGALSELHDSLADLGTSMRNCDMAFGSLTQDVARLNRQAHRLASIG